MAGVDAFGELLVERRRQEFERCRRGVPGIEPGVISGGTITGEAGSRLGMSAVAEASDERFGWFHPFPGHGESILTCREGASCGSVWSGV